MILRNEDLDVERSRKEYALQAQRDLDALGLFWDQGGDKGGHIVVTGTPEEVAACEASYTGQYLRPVLEK